jgi:serine-type D-Ala-D-Ala carboxypeptidase (penicillin-binding protein 5/6)
MLGRRGLLALPCLVAGLIGVGGTPAAGARRAETPPARAWLLADADSGAVLAARDEHATLPPASTVKLMSALVALEKLPLDSTVGVSARAAAQPPMKIGMKEGEVWKLDDVLHTLLIVSANDAAYAMAERASGSLEAFAADMNRAGARFGLRDSRFSDPSGQDDEKSFGGGSLMSAYDLAVVGRNALTVPQITNVTRLVDHDFTDPDGVHHTLTNHNKIFLTGYAGATGLKTGETDKAKGTLVATATRNGRTLIAVVLGADDARGVARWLLDQGFATPSAGARAHLPPVAVFTADARQAVVDVLPHTPRSAAGSTAASPAPSTPAASPAPTTRPAAGATSGGIFTVRNLVIVVLVLVGVVVALRRRAVKRRRRRRMERTRLLAEARRRGSLHVIDESPQAARSHVAVIRPGRGPRRMAGRKG